MTVGTLQGQVAGYIEWKDDSDGSRNQELGVGDCQEASVVDDPALLEKLKGNPKLRILVVQNPGAYAFSHIRHGPLCLKGLPGLEGVRIRAADFEVDAAMADLEECEGLRVLQLTGTRLTDEGLAYIGRLRHLKRLAVGATYISDYGLKHLQRLQELEVLDLYNTKIRGHGFEHLHELDKLHWLSLRNCSITDSELDYFHFLNGLSSLDLSLCPVRGEGLTSIGAGLRELYLEAAWITDPGLAAVASLTNLQLLNLADCRVGDAGLAALARLVSLESLGLNNTDVRDTGLEHLYGLMNLKDLSLRSTEVTNAGLVHLSGLKSLERLDLDSCSLTEQGLTYLQRLPKLRELWLSGGPDSSGSEQPRKKPQRLSNRAAKRVQDMLPKIKIHWDEPDAYRRWIWERDQHETG